VVSVVVAALLRLYLASQVDSISSDGVRYVETARHFYHGSWREGLTAFDPPGYALAIAAAYPLFHDWERAGTAVSLVAGMLILAPLLGFLRVCRVRGPGLAATMIGFALCPYPARYASVVRCEALYGLLFMVAVWAVASYLVKERRWFLVVAGGAAGLAYVVRPEGIGLTLACGAAIGLAFRDAGRRLAAAFKPFAIVTLIALAVATPYVVYLKSDTGRWTLSRKAANVVSLGIKTATGEGVLIEQAESDRQSFLGVVSKQFHLFARKLAVDSVRTFIAFADCLYYAYVPFLLIGIAIGRDRFGSVNWLLHVIIWFYLATFAIMYVDRRFYTALTPLAMVWSGAGFVWLWKWLAERQRTRTAIVVAAVVLAAILGKVLRIPRADQYARPLAREIARLTHGGAVVARVPQVAFYAGTKPSRSKFPIDRMQLSPWLESPETWLVVTEGDLTPDAESMLSWSPAARLISTVTEKKNVVRLYRLGSRVRESSAADPRSLDPSIPRSLDPSIPRSLDPLIP